MRGKQKLEALILGLALMGSAQAQGQSVPSVKVTMNKVIWGGSGCNSNNAMVQISPDNQRFMMTFDSFYLEKESDMTHSIRKNCNVQVLLNVPSGWSYSLKSLEFQGSYLLEAGVTAMQISNYSFVDPAKPYPVGASFYSKFSGPADEPHFMTNPINSIGKVWSPCGVTRPLRISTELRLSGPQGKIGFIEIDQMNAGAKAGKYHQTYALEWKKC